MNTPHQFKYEMGWEAQDTITGFKGLIVFRVQHITGCDGYGLQPTVNEQNEIPDSKQFDEMRIKIIGKGIYTQEEYDTLLASNIVQTLELPGGIQHNIGKRN